MSRNGLLVFKKGNLCKNNWYVLTCSFSGSRSYLGFSAIVVYATLTSRQLWGCDRRRARAPTVKKSAQQNNKSAAAPPPRHEVHTPHIAPHYPVFCRPSDRKAHKKRGPHPDISHLALGPRVPRPESLEAIKLPFLTSRHCINSLRYDRLFSVVAIKCRYNEAREKIYKTFFQYMRNLQRRYLIQYINIH